MLNARIRKRVAAGRCQDRADRRARRSHVSVRISRRRPADVGGRRLGRHRLRQDAGRREASAGHCRARRVTRADGPEILSLAAKIAGGEGRDEGWNGLAVLHTAAARVGALDLGLVPRDGALDTIGMVAASATKALDVLFLLGADEIAMECAGRCFRRLRRQPRRQRCPPRRRHPAGRRPTPEKSGTYVNTEGRVQMARRAGFPRRCARRLGDPPRPVGCARPEAAVRLPVGAACAALRQAPALRSCR